MRLALLWIVPAIWLVLMITGASQVDRTHVLSWLGLPAAVALAYVSLSVSVATGKPISPIVLALSVVALLLAVAGCIRGGLGSDDASRLIRISEFAVWAAAFAGAALATWHPAGSVWPRDGYIAIAVVHLLMIAPPALLFVLFLGGMITGG